MIDALDSFIFWNTYDKEVSLAEKLRKMNVTKGGD
jgi:hypothetical protein